MKSTKTALTFAGYVDFESHLSGQPGMGLLVGAAARGEQYSDFGATITGKATARYDLTKRVAFRTAGSTGFRAPLLHQLHFNNISTQFKADNNDADGDGNTTELLPFEVGTFQNDSGTARALNIPELKEETSVNVSSGIVVKPIQNLWCVHVFGVECVCVCILSYVFLRVYGCTLASVVHWLIIRCVYMSICETTCLQQCVIFSRLKSTMVSPCQSVFGCLMSGSAN